MKKIEDSNQFYVSRKVDLDFEVVFMNNFFLQGTKSLMKLSFSW